MRAIVGQHIAVTNRDRCRAAICRRRKRGDRERTKCIGDRLTNKSLHAANLDRGDAINPIDRKCAILRQRGGIG